MSAIADKPHFNVCNLWQKYKCKKRASLYATAQKTFWNSEPYRRAHQLLPMFK